MPISKKPRKKPAPKSKGAPRADAATPLPDRRSMEAFMPTVLARRRGSDPTEAAQAIMYDAWEATSRAKRVALAKKALTISPLCADAYVLLAEEEASSLAKALDYYQRGVEGGELALGEEFEEYAGHFWGFLETRPYMRARAGLAATLWQLGRHQEAMEHYWAMLALNPNDNQGLRYVLASHLLTRGEIQALKLLIKQYEEDGAATFLYTQVLLAFRESDPDAEKLAEQAWLANSHVPAMLAGKTPLVVSTDGYITMGGADEAGEYINENGKVWHATPGAVTWLERVTASLTPKRERQAAATS